MRGQSLVDSILVCRGPVRSNQYMSKCIVLAIGDVTVTNEAPNGIIRQCVVFCDGNVVIDSVADSLVIATGAVTVKHGRIGQESLVIQGTRTPLPGLRFYDTSEAGIEVAKADKASRSRRSSSAPRPRRAASGKATALSPPAKIR